jgi:hypothetical protein
MEHGGAVTFEKGSVYTRRQIHEVVGGSARAALPTRGGTVVCACLTREKNPRAPQEMVVGGKERSVRLARTLAASGAAVPVFVRTRQGGWEFTGVRRVRSVIEEPGALLALVAEGAPPDILMALHLEETVGAAAGSHQPPIAPGA